MGWTHEPQSLWTWAQDTSPLAYCYPLVLTLSWSELPLHRPRAQVPPSQAICPAFCTLAAERHSAYITTRCSSTSSPGLNPSCHPGACCPKAPWTSGVGRGVSTLDFSFTFCKTNQNRSPLPIWPIMGSGSCLPLFIADLNWCPRHPLPQPTSQCLEHFLTSQVALPPLPVPPVATPGAAPPRGSPLLGHDLHPPSSSSPGLSCTCLSAAPGPPPDVFPSEST